MNYEEHLSDTDLCVVAFASDGGKKYDFHDTLEKRGCSYVLMRDTPDRWYTQGIDGLGDSNVVAAYIHGLSIRYRKVICAGVSFGAWGALMYGQMAAVHEIVAISPLTAIGKAAQDELAPKWHHRVESEHSLDLKPFFVNTPISPIVRIFISDGDGAELDMWMATRLGSCEVVTDPKPDALKVRARGLFYVSLIPGHTHGGLAKHMRDTGWFERLFR
jgi:hypothetical protein